MPRRGGEADKAGNIYEGLWMVDAVLDLFEGKYVTLEVERVGDEAAGVEFVLVDRSSTEEFHTIKRQHSEGNWTVSRLHDEQVLDSLLSKALSGADAVFSSGTSATRFEVLIQCATQFASIETFKRRIGDNAQLSADFYDRILPLCSDDEIAAYEALKRLKIRVKNETELRLDVERRIRSTLQTNSAAPIDPRAVRLLIVDFMMDRLGNPLEARFFQDELATHGVVQSQWVGDEAIEESILRRNRMYISAVKDLHINRTEMTRRETDVTQDALLGLKKEVMIEGIAGSGKSSVVAQAVGQLAVRGVPSLVVNLDRLNQKTDTSAQAMGTNLGLPDSPAISLGEFAGTRPSVLVIDQLDALSVVSARQQWAWDTLYELLDEARSYPEMRILFACRSFDLEQDGRLRRLADDPKRVERIRVEPLAEDAIRGAIAASGIGNPALSKEQVEVLSTPLHLYLFLEASRSERVDFGAAGDLFDAFWRYKERTVIARLNGPQSLWESAVAALCKELSDRESLVAPEYAMSKHRLTLEAMASEGVVTARDEQVRFFHESFFDYAFARTFVGADEGRDLAEWLAKDEQALFRRSQVRQVLAFLRRDPHDRKRYLQTLAGVLSDPRVRFHIKRLVLDWLRSLDDPTAREWNAVEAASDELGPHVWDVVRNSAPWFDVLAQHGKWDNWLNAEGETLDRAIHLRALPDGRIAESTRRRIQELERKFPEAREHGAPEPPPEDDGFRTEPPIPERAYSHMSDDQWLAAMRRYTDDSKRFRDGELIGRATELSYGLEREARKAPSRFAALTDSMDDSCSKDYFRAILRGLTSDDTGASSGQFHEQVCIVLRRIAELGIDLPSREIAGAAYDVAQRGLPDDIVQSLCRIAVEDSDPEEDRWFGPDEATRPMTQAMNSARGTAAMAISRLLFADTSSWQALRPVVEHLVTDPVLAVRSVAASCLLAVIDHEREEALALFEQLAEGADAIMGSYAVERFIHYAIFRDYDAMRPHLSGMLESSSDLTVRIAGRQLTVAALYLESKQALDDQRLAIEARSGARVGAAEIYVANLADPTIGQECQAHLRSLFDDDNQAVRAAAGEWWMSASANELALSRSLLADYTRSRTFDEHNTSVMLHRLKEATSPLPIELCDVADRAVDQFGPKASSIQYAEAGVARNLAELMIRLHEQTNADQRSRVLDSIDRMLFADFHGMHEHLELHATR